MDPKISDVINFVGKLDNVACTHVQELVILHHVILLLYLLVLGLLVGKHVVHQEETVGIHAVLFVTPLHCVLMLDASFGSQLHALVEV